MLGHCATWGQKEDLSGASSRDMKLGVEVRQWEAEPQNSQVGGVPTWRMGTPGVASPTRPSLLSPACWH